MVCLFVCLLYTALTFTLDRNLNCLRASPGNWTLITHAGGEDGSHYALTKHLNVYTVETVYPLPKFTSCHKAIMVITGRAHCYSDSINPQGRAKLLPPSVWLNCMHKWHCHYNKRIWNYTFVYAVEIYISVYLWFTSNLDCTGVSFDPTRVWTYNFWIIKEHLLPLICSPMSHQGPHSWSLCCFCVSCY